MLPRLRPLLLLAGLALSIVLTYVVLRDIDFDAFLDALSSGEPVWYLASFAVFVAAYAVRVLRWRILFEPGARPPVRPLVRASLVGDFLTSLMPVLRLGEIARVVVLHREARTSRSVALGTIVTERLQDSIALLLLLFVAVPFAPPVSWLRGATLLLAVLLIALGVSIYVLARFGSRPLGFLLRPLTRLPGFSRVRTEVAAEGIVRGLAGLRNARLALAAFALSLLVWLGVSLSYTLALRGAGLELGLDAGILVAVATTFSLLLPALPASVGIFEAATLVALEPYGVDSARALSGAVVIHVLTFLPFLILGPIALRGVTKRPERLTAPSRLAKPGRATSRPPAARTRGRGPAG
ncbi:MAG: lysylphosphatidylglycerol synthase transmembrane domain-containing protein [Gaiellaceae bacterium]